MSSLRRGGLELNPARLSVVIVVLAMVCAICLSTLRFFDSSWRSTAGAGQLHTACPVVRAISSPESLHVRSLMGSRLACAGERFLVPRWRTVRCLLAEAKSRSSLSTAASGSGFCGVFASWPLGAPDAAGVLRAVRGCNPAILLIRSCGLRASIRSSSGNRDLPIGRSLRPMFRFRVCLRRTRKSPGRAS